MNEVEVTDSTNPQPVVAQSAVQAAAGVAVARGRRNELVGVVVSDKMQKSLRVRVSRLVRHARYGKYVRRASVFMAHDEKNEAQVGDKVSLVETRALSKTKRWKLANIVEKAKK